MSFLLEFLTAFWNRLFQLFSYRCETQEHKLRVYIKTNAGYMLSELEPQWSIQNVKRILAPSLGLPADELKIIFAGKELSDETTVDECDLGQQSVLHAVRRRSKLENQRNLKMQFLEEELKEEGQGAKLAQQPSKPLCVTLRDLQLQTEEQPNAEDADCGRIKAHFYVHCTECKKLCRGKLRVRCSLCKNGAFTVYEDPKCWSDVLKPSRISGVCENHDGDSGEKKYAEFYFKCAEHVSSGENDFAAPLDLVKINIQNVPCLACTVVDELVVVFPCALKHITCIDCFVQYCRSRLSERRFVLHPAIGYTLPCPAGCKDALIESLQHFKLMPPLEYERYLQFATEEFVLQSGGVLCPQPDCGMGLLVDQECQHNCDCICCENCLKEFQLGNCSSIDCSYTGYGGCLNHVDSKLVAAVNRDEASKLTILGSTKPCPKCRTPTERAGGCMHMTCTRGGCGFEWCWICQTEWTRYCQCNHWFGNF